MSATYRKPHSVFFFKVYQWSGITGKCLDFYQIRGRGNCYKNHTFTGVEKSVDSPENIPTILHQMSPTQSRLCTPAYIFCTGGWTMDGWTVYPHGNTPDTPVWPTKHVSEIFLEVLWNSSVTVASKLFYCGFMQYEPSSILKYVY